MVNVDQLTPVLVASCGIRPLLDPNTGNTLPALQLIGQVVETGVTLTSAQEPRHLALKDNTGLFRPFDSGAYVSSISPWSLISSEREFQGPLPPNIRKLMSAPLVITKAGTSPGSPLACDTGGLRVVLDNTEESPSFRRSIVDRLYTLRTGTVTANPNLSKPKDTGDDNSSIYGGRDVFKMPDFWSREAHEACEQAAMESVAAWTAALRDFSPRIKVALWEMFDPFRISRLHAYNSASTKLICPITSLQAVKTLLGIPLWRARMLLNNELPNSGRRITPLASIAPRLSEVEKSESEFVREAWSFIRSLLLDGVLMSSGIFDVEQIESLLCKESCPRRMVPAIMRMVEMEQWVEQR